MRILLDECMPVGLISCAAFAGREVDHVAGIGMSGVTNGELHDFASSTYDLFVTSDRHFRRKPTLGPTPTMGVVYVEEDGRTGNLGIACIEPTFIQGPTDWQDSDIEIEATADGFVLIDRKAGVRVEAEHVELAENRKPYNAFTRGAGSDGVRWRAFAAETLLVCR